MPRHGRFTPGKGSRYPLYSRLADIPGPVWTGTENLTTTGFRFPDCPARNESLYRLHYLGPHELRGIGIEAALGATSPPTSRGYKISAGVKRIQVP
jgi:hypothetical protein